MSLTPLNTRGPKQGFGSPQQAVKTVHEYWGEAAPEWVLMLAEACDRSSQSAIAKRLNYSASVISSVLKKNYAGRMPAIEQAVRGALMAETHFCPVVGEIPKHICLEHQKKAKVFQATSSLRVRLYQACRGDCPFSRLHQKQGEGDAQ